MSGNKHSLKALYVIHSENIPKIDLVFHKLHKLRTLLVSQTISNIYKNYLKDKP